MHIIDGRQRIIDIIHVLTYLGIVFPVYEIQLIDQHSVCMITVCQNSGSFFNMVFKCVID